jgi:hypothetical protein
MQGTPAVTVYVIRGRGFLFVGGWLAFKSPSSTMT